MRYLKKLEQRAALQATPVFAGDSILQQQLSGTQVCFRQRCRSPVNTAEHIGMRRDDHLMSMHGRLRDAGSRMAAAAEQSIQQSIVEAKADIREAKEQLQGATGDEKVALQQRLAALEQRLTTLEQQKLLQVQQQSGAIGWTHSRGAGLLVANLPIHEQVF
jgi:septal ring factor EnvC (AmiA/AmiB activator)